VCDADSVGARQHSATTPAHFASESARERERQRAPERERERAREREKEREREGGRERGRERERERERDSERVCARERERERCLAHVDYPSAEVCVESSEHTDTLPRPQDPSTFVSLNVRLKDLLGTETDHGEETDTL